MKHEKSGQMRSFSQQDYHSSIPISQNARNSLSMSSIFVKASAFVAVCRNQMFRPRRRHRFSTRICALTAAVLLLLSVTLLHSRLNLFQSHVKSQSISQLDAASLTINPLLDDITDPLDRATGSDDLIDELDDASNNAGGMDGDSEEELDEESDVVTSQLSNNKFSSLYYFDHINGVIRRGLNKKSIEDWEDYVDFESNLRMELGFNSKGLNLVFGSDDIPVDEKIRTKLTEIRNIEDALLLKGSKLRDGWGEWFDKKSDFLRRDKMFKSNLDSLNPQNNPLLQDPDGPGITWLTKGDKLMQKGLLNDLKKVKFIGETPLGVKEPNRENSAVESKLKVTERKILDGNDDGKAVNNEHVNTDHDSSMVLKVNHDEGRKKENGRKTDTKKVKAQFSGPMHADGKRWGYYPGIDARLSFPNFMDAFFRKGKCSTRVFMVWNSPPWMFGVRQQRGLESIIVHHRDACVVVFSETLELNFFSSFVNDGFKVAIAMPNLDALLKDTPAHVFASVWHQWKKTKFYPIHYSELIRLAALYKYGGVYLDFDVIVLKPSLFSLDSVVGLEDGMNESSLNGAVMAFRKHSPFIKECLNEFYASYDDTLLRWNGAELLSRVARNNVNSTDKKLELNLHPPVHFFPLNHENITRYFIAPDTESERVYQESLFNKILSESITVHFWHSSTSALVPEPESLVSRLLNHYCIRCSDVL